MRAEQYREELKQIGYVAGREEGYVNGREEEIRRSIFDLIRKGLSDEDVLHYVTDSTPELIQEVRRKTKNHKAASV